MLIQQHLCVSVYIKDSVETMRTPRRVKNEERIILLRMIQGMKNKGGVALGRNVSEEPRYADLGRSLHRFGKGTFYLGRRSVASW